MDDHAAQNPMLLPTLPQQGVPPLPVKLLRPGAKAPVRAKPRDVGYDVFADLSAVEGQFLLDVPERGLRSGLVTNGEAKIQPALRAKIPLGFAAALRDGTYGRIAERSGLAEKHGIRIGGGVVDPSYRGELMAVVFNNGTEPFVVRHGDKIAQIVIERVETPDVVIVDELDETERGALGFGSTGHAS